MIRVGALVKILGNEHPSWDIIRGFLGIVISNDNLEPFPYKILLDDKVLGYIYGGEIEEVPT